MAVAAKRRAQLVVHEPIEQRMLGAQQQPRAAVIPGSTPIDRRLRGELEDRPLAVVGGILFRGVVDLLENPRYRNHNGGFEHRKQWQQILDVAGESDGHLAGEGRQGKRPGQHVGQWQEDQQPLPGGQQRG